MSRPPLSQNPRGYVLIIVLVVGLAASLAAISLSQSAGSALIESMHTDNGDRAQGVAEAGMMRAVAFLQAVTGNSQDFDGVLDRGLNSVCNATAGTVTPQADDGTPEWTDATVVQLNTNSGTKGFGCVLMDLGTTNVSGAYLVRFDDDDDDDPWKSEWEKVTGNNPTNDCQEGPDPSQAVNSDSFGGKNNPLRDRNRTIWVTVIGAYPATSCTTAAIEDATHRATIRRMHSAPRFPSVAGIQVKGNINVQGNSDMGACSEIGSLEVDGSATGSGDGCACGFSAADSWTTGTWDHCTTSGAISCATTVNDGEPGHQDYTLPGCLTGQLETPGPVIPNLPSVTGQTGQYVDWDRPCTFYIDIDSTTGDEGIWFWDSNRSMDGSVSCGSYEGNSGGDAPFPGPPNPSAAYSPLGTGNTPDWTGCWTPVILGAGPPGGASWATATSPTSGVSDVNTWVMPTTGCMGPPWRATGTSYGTASPVWEWGNSGSTPDECTWRPTNLTGEYETCYDGPISNLDSDGTPGNETNCGEQGLRCNSGAGTGGPLDYTDCDAGVLQGPLNWQLERLGINQFPDGVQLNKPNWQAECTVQYPPFGTTTTPYACTNCTGTQDAMTRLNGGSKHWWFTGQTNAQVTALPAGVYWWSDDLSLSGGGWDWHEDAHPSDTLNGGNPDPEINLAAYPLVTMMTAGDIDLQPDGYFFGFGQTDNGAGSGNERYIPSIVTGGDTTMRGGAGESIVGSIYANGNVEWRGGGMMYLFGELYTDGNFDVGGSGNFWWLYRVSLQEPQTGTSGMPPTQFKSSF